MKLTKRNARKSAANEKGRRDSLPAAINLYPVVDTNKGHSPKDQTVHLPFIPGNQNTQAVACSLHCGGSRTALAFVVPDLRCPNMHRIMWPAGGMSDLANLTRCKDAVLLIAATGPARRDACLLHWKWHHYDSPRHRVCPRQAEKSDAGTWKLASRGVPS